MDSCIAPVELNKAYRLINHGPTVLVSGHHAGVDNVMAAAWACGLDFEPPKLTVVLDMISSSAKSLPRGPIRGSLPMGAGISRLPIQPHAACTTLRVDVFMRSGMRSMRMAA